MSKINIAGIADVTDPFYRYKMNKVKIQKQKTKTAILNLKQIAEDLGRDVVLIIDYIKKKLGMSLTINKTDYSVTTFKDIDPSEIEKCIREYIEYFVLCEKCKNPETIFEIKKEVKTLTCKACSHVTTVKK
jgi:translation initiation factor 2 beta subunit (eIF-2beta)/eIF-5